ncbi:hypothetical protein VOWphi5012_088 [Vibrio phage phi50-12]|uniref:Uncharacterized protein n=1 Tax=Vibrio phage phi50-12 TaxID=2654972 RepID=A0A5P8PSU2_9CAUD|nr:hypothetical protein KNU82_gp088 [Vibrio phage phi50-12]QFR59871.1 hypothetical protein VOWphi5012_088 [Vibrio phage phi50-12]
MKVLATINEEELRIYLLYKHEREWYKPFGKPRLFTQLGMLWIDSMTGLKVPKGCLNIIMEKPND